MPLTSQIYTSFDELQTHASQWQALHDQDSRATFFMQPHYQLSWWHHLRPPKAELRVIVVMTKDGVWQACYPLFFDPAQAGYFLIGGLDESDYLDLLLADTCDQQAVLALLRQAMQSLPAAPMTCFSLKPTSHIVTELLPNLEQPWTYTQTQQTVCPVITLPQDMPGFLTTLDSSFAKSLKRSRAAAADEGELRLDLSTPDSVATDSQTFMQLHQQSSTAKTAFWTPARQAFFHDLMVKTAALDQLKLYLLHLDNDPAAALLIFDYRHEFLLYNSGFNAFRYGHLRVGNLIVEDTIAAAIDLGRQRYDFMRGDEAYKFQFGAKAEPVFDVHLTP